MAKGQSLQLPATPEHYSNSNLRPNIDFGSNYFRGLLQGDFTGDRSWLSPLTNTNTSRDALSYAQGILQPQFRDTLNQIQQNATNNGQENSSTYTDALARSQSDLNSQYQSIVSQGAINDAYQNNSNRLSLLGQGQQGLLGFTSAAQGETNATNQFNLDNYSNLVAKAIQDNQNANKANGWQQALGMFSPIGHDYLQSQGINSVPGYGVGQTLQFASMFGGMGGFNGFGGGGGGSMVGQSGLSNQLRQPAGNWGNFSMPQQDARMFSSAPYSGFYAR